MSLNETAGNIRRMLGFNQASADWFQKTFGPLDFTVAKLCRNVAGPGGFEYGAIEIDPINHFKLLKRDEDISMVAFACIDELNLKARFSQFGDDDGDADFQGKLIEFLKGKPKLVKQINSGPNSPDLIDVFRNAIVINKPDVHPDQVILELPGGWKWIDLQSCDSGTEGAEMQHCGRDARGTLVSLRDPKNGAHVTATYEKENKEIVQIRGKQNAEPAKKYWPMIRDLVNHLNAKIDWSDFPSGGGLETWITNGGDIPESRNESVNEGRKSSTAAVIVPSNPPGKNLCSFLRSIASTRSKVIVIGQPGQLAPGNLQALLKVQMPDVTKIEVIDIAEAGGNSVSDAIEAMEAGGLYKSGEALELFCSPEIAQSFADEIRSGELSLDPTTIAIHSQDIPADDVESIVAAVKDKDQEAMKQVLDPRIFSDRESVADYASAMFDGSPIGTFNVGGESQSAVKTESAINEREGLPPAKPWPPGDMFMGIKGGVDHIGTMKFNRFVEIPEVVVPTRESIAVQFEEVDGTEIGTIREFLVDISPDRDVAIQVLHDILASKLAIDGLSVDDLEYLGTGRNGSAYRSPDGLILKITTDPTEASSAEKLVGKPMEYIHLVHSVTKLSEQVWLIEQEGNLEKLPGEYSEEFDLAMEMVEAMGAGHAMREGDTRSMAEVLRNCEDKDAVKDVCEILKRFGVVGMCKEIRSLGLSGDFHSGNIMLRSGVPVLTDLGTPGDAPGTVSESQINELLKDIGGEAGAKKILQANKAILSSKGLFADKLSPVGQGAMGVVFRIGDGRVLKVTTDGDEVKTVSVIKGKNLRHVVKFYDVFPLHNEGAKVWAVIADECQKMSQQEEFDIMDVAERLRDPRVIEAAATKSWSDVVAAVQKSITDDVTEDMGGDMNADPSVQPQHGAPTVSSKITKVVSRQMADFQTKAKKYHISNMIDELRSIGVEFADYKPENIMKSGGNYVIVDLSMSKSGKGGLGEASGQAGPQAGGNLRGSGSSAWSGGMAVLAEPEQHVPKDDNELENGTDTGLDWGFYGNQPR